MDVSGLYMGVKWGRRVMCVLALLPSQVAWSRHAEPGSTNGEGVIAPCPVFSANLNWLIALEILG